jgi:hypothetical protein
MISTLKGMKTNYGIGPFKKYDVIGNGMFYKTNATFNRIYDSYRQQKRLAKMAPEQFSAEVRNLTKANTGQNQSIVSYLYNPVGRILSEIGTMDHASFIKRGHNLEGLRRLALLKVMAHRESVSPDGMSRFLDSHRKDLGNPYTGEAMEWAPNKGRIFFRDISNEKPVEIFI